MDSNKIFRVSIGVSFAVHAVVLFQSPHLSLFRQPDKEARMELKYIPVKKEQPKPRNKTQIIRKSDPFLKLPPKISMDSATPAPYQNRDKLPTPQNMMLKGDMRLAKPSLIKPEIIAIKKKISLPSVKPTEDMAKINNPSYINYYQMVREKIRRAAYQNYTHNRTGELYITFIVAGDGHVKEVRLVEERSTAEAYLKDVGLRSIRDASPFPNFPKELDYPELSFNVIISFEIE